MLIIIKYMKKVDNCNNFGLHTSLYYKCRIFNYLKLSLKR